MAIRLPYDSGGSLQFSWSEWTGAIGDSVTVLPIVVSVAVLTDLSLALLLVWFGVFQVVWGLYYGAPVSVEPMKALAALVLSGTITTGEFLLSGLFAGVVLLGIGAAGSLERVSSYVGSPVVRGIQLAVALVLLETGVGLAGGDPRLAGLAAVVAVGVVGLGYANLSALFILLLGGVIATASVGVPSPTLPGTDGLFVFGVSDLTRSVAEATIAQLVMSVGNAALATSLLLDDYFDRDISADDLSSSMGVMNLVAVPLGAVPMCHGSGGVAGKYAFGARTAGANVILGLGYVAVAVFAAGIVVAYPVSMLGVLLVVVALQLGWTSLGKTDERWLAAAIGVCGLVVNLGVAFLIGIVGHQLLSLYRDRRNR